MIPLSSFLLTVTFAGSCLATGPQDLERECFIKDFSRNLTFKVGQTVRLDCNTNCPHSWSYSASHSGPARQIASDFYNPPYFYLMAATEAMTGYYHCKLEDGLEAVIHVNIEADVRDETFVETDEGDLNTLEDVTEATVVKRPEVGGSRLVEIPQDEEEDILTSSDLARLVSSQMEAIFRQLSDISQRLDHIEHKWKADKA